MEITQKSFDDTMHYEEMPVLKYSVKIPKIWTGNYHSDTVINRYYEQMTGKLLYEYIPQLYHDAAAGYINSRKNGFPFYMTEYNCTFTVGQSKAGLLSICFDINLFIGGINGKSERYCDTWNIYSGKRVKTGTK